MKQFLPLVWSAFWLVTGSPAGAMLATAWHIPDNASDLGFNMRNPEFAIGTNTTVTFYTGIWKWNSGVQIANQTGGTLFYKSSTQSNWSSTGLNFYSNTSANQYWQASLNTAAFNANEVGCIVQRLSHDFQHRKTGNGGRAEIDDFDLSVRPRVTQHLAQKCRCRQVSRLWKTFGSGFTHDENPHGIRAFWLVETILLVVAGPLAIGKKVGSRARRIADDQGALISHPRFSQNGRIAAETSDSQTTFQQPKHAKRQKEKNADKYQSLAREKRGLAFGRRGV
jgi:hypothetical protein